MSQREPARNSAKQREPARANASQTKPSQARASARRVGRGIPSERAQKGRQRPTYFELFLKRGAIAKFPLRTRDGGTLYSREKTSYRRTPSREAQIILKNWHFFELRVLFLIRLAFLLVSGWLRLCFSACGGGRADGERNMLESYVWGGVLRVCSAIFALVVVFPYFCPHGPQTLKYPGACSSTPAFRTRRAAICHSESMQRRGRVAMLP